jgi:adenosylcobinamide-GDP ribazoletransferase
VSSLTRLPIRFLGAVQFLTVFPIRRSTTPPHEAAIFFPVVAAFIGVLSALPIVLLPVPLGLRAALALLIQVTLTGMLHEDGLADIADGVRAGRPREQMFEIIKDSRVGSYGATALVVALLLRWQGIFGTADPYRTGSQLISCIAAAEALSRCSILWLAHFTPAARPGMAAWLSENRSWPTFIASIVQAALFALAAGIGTAPYLLVGLALIVVFARAYFLQRLGGVVGDCFGALQQVSVIYCLLVFSWPIFF